MEEKLKALLRNDPAASPDAGWRCASESQLAAYVDGGLDLKGRQSLERHLVNCKFCLEQVSFLVHSADCPESSDVPPWLVTKVKNLVSEKRKASIVFNWRWATAALAACLAVAFLFVLVIRLRPSAPNQQQSVAAGSQPNPPAAPTPSDTPRNPDVVAVASRPASTKPVAIPGAESSVPLIRKGQVENRSLKLLSPRDGAVIKRGPLEIRWQTVPEAVSYEVSVMSAAGDTVTSQSTADEFVNISAAGLTSGTKYFVSVRAHLRDGRTARSTVSFYVAQ